MLFIFFTPIVGSDQQSEVVMKDEAARPQRLFGLSWRESQVSRLHTRTALSGGSAQ